MPFSSLTFSERKVYYIYQKASVKKGDVVIVLEAMKLENEICAAQDGKIASVEVAVGDMVEGGDVLVSMN